MFSFPVENSRTTRTVYFILTGANGRCIIHLETTRAKLFSYPIVGCRGSTPCAGSRWTYTDENSSRGRGPTTDTPRGFLKTILQIT